MVALLQELTEQLEAGTAPAIQSWESLQSVLAGVSAEQVPEESTEHKAMLDLLHACFQDQSVEHLTAGPHTALNTLTAVNDRLQHSEKQAHAAKLALLQTTIELKQAHSTFMDGESMALNSSDKDEGNVKIKMLLQVRATLMARCAEMGDADVFQAVLDIKGKVDECLDEVKEGVRERLEERLQSSTSSLVATVGEKDAWLQGFTGVDWEQLKQHAKHTLLRVRVDELDKALFKIIEARSAATAAEELHGVHLSTQAKENAAAAVKTAHITKHTALFVKRISDLEKTKEDEVTIRRAVNAIFKQATVADVEKEEFYHPILWTRVLEARRRSAQ